MAEIEVFSSPESGTANNPSSSSSYPSTINYGGRAIDRHNPIIRDFQRRVNSSSPLPPSPSSSSSSSAYLPTNHHRRRWYPHRHLHFFSKKKESHFLRGNLHGSTRFLLNSELDLCPPPPPYIDSAPPPPVSSSEQVVVLSVSLHCKGCEGKLRKHISKMEGVSSFSIDFAEKKVTVVGDVTPLSVLESVSKVKKAQIWAPMAVVPHST